MHVQERLSLWRRVGVMLGLVKQPVTTPIVTNARQDYKQQLGARIQRLEAVFNVGNGNGDQQQQNDEARAKLMKFSKRAAQASLEMESPDSCRYSMEAVDAHRQGNPAAAYDAHVKAAGEHDDEANKLRDAVERDQGKQRPKFASMHEGMLEDASAHDNAAALHRKAASKAAAAHLALNRNSTIPTDLGFTWPSLEEVFNAEKQVTAKAKKAARIMAGDDEAGAGNWDDSDSGMDTDDASADLEGGDLPNRTSFEQRLGGGSLASGQPITDDDLTDGPPPTKTPKEMLEEAGLTLPDNKPSQWWSEDMADSNFALAQDNFQKLGLLTRQPQPQGMSRTSLTAGQVQNCGTPSHLIVNNDRWATMTMSQQQEALRKGYRPAHMVYNLNGWGLVANAQAAPTADGGMDAGFAWPSLFDANVPTVNQIGAVPVTNQQAQGQARFPQHVIDSVRQTYGPAAAAQLNPVLTVNTSQVMVDATGPQVEGLMESFAREGAEARRRTGSFYGF